MPATLEKRQSAKLVTTVRLSPIVKAQVAALEAKLAMTQTGVIETAIRALARAEHVDVSSMDDASIQPAPDPLYLLTRPMAERRAALAASAAAAVGLYEEDLARPIDERELTAFEHIDDFMEPDEYLKAVEHADA
jgi:hypothetical protein